MSRHVVLGKGPVGSTLAALLARQGHEVVVVSRSGGASTAEVRHVAADASDTAALTAAARGADAVYSCVNPPYDRWPQVWPTMHAAMLDAAEATGAVLVMTGNLYGYGAGSGVMTETTPLATTETKGRVRVQMWHEAERRHRAGRVRVTEVRGSDYLGPGTDAPTVHAGSRLMGPLLAGRTLRPIGDPDQPHAWTYLPDFAAALAAAGVTPEAWGRAWLAPDAGARTFRELATALAAEAGVPVPRIAAVTGPALALGGAVVPVLREVRRVSYQFTAPFVVDATASQHVLGVPATPWPTVVAETVAWWRSRLPAAA